VSTRTEVQLWAQDFDFDERDIYAVQERIAAKVSGALKFKPTRAGASVSGKPAANLRARDLYWMGRFSWRERTDESLSQSLGYFQRAIAQDPAYALAYSGLADSYCVIAERNILPPRTALLKAREAANRAVALDKALPDGYISLAQVTSLYDRDYVAAEQNFQRALTLDSRSVLAHQWYAYMLLKLRRFDEALRHARRALDLDPLSAATNLNYAVQLFYKGDYDLAVDACRTLGQIDSQRVVSHLMVAHILARRGLAGEAKRELQSVAENGRDNSLILRTAGEVHALSGQRSEAERDAQALIARKNIEGIPASYIAIVYATLGEKDEAFYWLQLADKEQDGFLVMLNAYPAFESLRGDARFSSLLITLGLGAPPH
jgi:tetratricopeptide (TPR) repeat protein